MGQYKFQYADNFPFCNTRCNTYHILKKTLPILSEAIKKIVKLDARKCRVSFGGNKYKSIKFKILYLKLLKYI